METKTEKNLLLSFSDIFAYRDLWMAVAILMVVFSHVPMVFPPALDVLNFIREYCYLGVDMFLFASGIGCYYSLKKDPDVVRFLKRRAWSTMPMWLIFLVFWVPLAPRTGAIEPLQILGNLLGIGTVAALPNQYNWYICGMWICYLLTPVFVGLAEQYRRLWQRGIVLLLLFGLSLCFLHQRQLIMWSRLMIYFVGICTAASAGEREGLSKKGFAVSLVFMALGIGFLAAEDIFWHELRWPLGLLWYPCLFIAPGLCYLISWLGSLADKTWLKVPLAVFRKLGKHTFALFLTQGLVLGLFVEMVQKGQVKKDALGALLGAAALTAATLGLTALDRMVKKLLTSFKS